MQVRSMQISTKKKPECRAIMYQYITRKNDVKIELLVKESSPLFSN